MESSRKDSSRLQQSQEAKKRRHEELQRQKQEEQLRKIQEREQKRQQAALIKEQVWNSKVIIFILFLMFGMSIYLFLCITQLWQIPEKKCNIEKSHYFPPKIKLTL